MKYNKKYIIFICYVFIVYMFVIKNQNIIKEILV